MTCGRHAREGFIPRRMGRVKWCALRRVSVGPGPGARNPLRPRARQRRREPGGDRRQGGREGGRDGRQVRGQARREPRRKRGRHGPGHGSTVRRRGAVTSAARGTRGAGSGPWMGREGRDRGHRYGRGLGRSGDRRGDGSRGSGRALSGRRTARFLRIAGHHRKRPRQEHTQRQDQSPSHRTERISVHTSCESRALRRAGGQRLDPRPIMG